MPAIEEYDLENMWIQQNGGTCHTTRANRVLLQETFSWPRDFPSWRYQLDTKIIRFDIIRLFFVGLREDRVYADKPSTLEHLKTNFRQVTAEIPPNMCQKVLATLRVEVP